MKWKERWKKGLRVGAMAMVLLILVVGAFSWVNAQSVPAKSIEKEDEGDVGAIRVDKLKEIVTDIEEKHCKMSDEELLDQKLTKEDIKKVRAFCKLPAKEKEKKLEKEFKKINEKKCSEGEILSRNNSYSCRYDGYNWGIPNYADLGLSSSSCSWHDDPPNPTDCKVEGEIACLWGCTNSDPVLGWHEKWFASTTALENEIFPKDYHRVSSNYGGSYRRWVDYSYSYQVHSIGGGWWHSEGPEPSPEFSWYAYLRGWWPVEISVWHDDC